MLGLETIMLSCLICDKRLSKREKKAFKAIKQVATGRKPMSFCTDCAIGTNKVAAKMKRRY